MIDGRPGLARKKAPCCPLSQAPLPVTYPGRSPPLAHQFYHRRPVAAAPASATPAMAVLPAADHAAAAPAGAVRAVAVLPPPILLRTRPSLPCDAPNSATAACAAAVLPRLLLPQLLVLWLLLPQLLMRPS